MVTLQAWPTGLGVGGGQFCLDNKLTFDDICRLGGHVQAGLSASEPDLELARFQHPVSAFIGEGHLPGSEGELDGLSFTRRETKRV